MKEQKQRLKINLPKSTKIQSSLSQIHDPVQNHRELLRMRARAYENAFYSKTKRTVETEQEEQQ
jgi:hypothetical protein